MKIIRCLLLFILAVLPLSCLNRGEFSSCPPRAGVLELGTTAVFFGPDASSCEVKVISGDEWTAECCDSWLEIMPSDSILAIRSTPNDSPDDREGMISVSTKDRSAVLKVTQKALSTSISISRQSLSCKASALSETISLSANYPYSVTVEGNESGWLNLSLPSPMDGGNLYAAGTDIPIGVSASIPDESRIATVKFSVPDMSCVLKVTQTLADLEITVDFCDESASKVKQPFTTNIPTSIAASTALGTSEIQYVMKIGDTEYAFATRCPVKGTSYYIDLTSTKDYGTGLFVKGGGTATSPLTYIKLPAVPGRTLNRIDLAYGLTPVADYPLYICSDASSFSAVSASTVAGLTANVNVSKTDSVDLSSSDIAPGTPYYIVFGSTSRFFLCHLKLVYN